MSWPLLALIDDLDCRDRCVVRERVKCEIEFTLRRGSQVIERLGQGVKTADFLEDIEIVEQRCAVAVDTKYAAANANLPGRVRYPIQLGKVENERVMAARIDRNGIGEMTIPFLSVELWIGSTTDLAWRVGNHAILEVVVGMPQVPVTVSHCSRLHDEPDRDLAMRQTRQ